jgi:signal transduction histidine kinase
LALGIILGFLIIFTIFGLLSMRMINDSTNRILEERQVLTQMAANEIDAMLSQAFYQLDAAPTFARFDPQATNLDQEQEVLSLTYGRLSVFSLGVYFYDATGKIVIVEPYDAAVIGSDHSTEAHIRQVITSGERSMSAPYLVPKTGDIAVALVVPIKDEQGRLISILSGIIDLATAELRRPIEIAMRLGTTGHAEIVDNQGLIITSTLSRTFLEAGEHQKWYQQMMAQKMAGVESVPDEYHADLNPHDHVMAFVPLNMADWGVAIGGDTSETFAPVITMRNSILLLGGLTLLAIITATLIGARRLVRPVNILTRSAQRIAKGDLTSDIQISEGGEIGLLGKSLNEMRLRLRDSIDEIQRWNAKLEERVKVRTRKLKHTLEKVSKLNAIREADRLKSEFISSISHELRTPLGFITGYVTTLLRSDVSHSEETTQEFLQIIKEESEKLQELVENLLDTSRVQAGSFAVEKRPIDIMELVQKVVEKAQLITDQHSFVLRFDPSLPLTPGDSRRLEQVLHNLVDNATKYSPRGSQITVSGMSEDDHIQVSITDEGQGIPQAELTNIFDAFYRIPNPDALKVKGVGLGLTICKAIVDAHGGNIWAESAPNKGSVFYFTLPLQEDAP